MLQTVTFGWRARLRRALLLLVAVVVGILAVDVAFLAAHRVVPGAGPRGTFDARGT